MDSAGPLVPTQMSAWVSKAEPAYYWQYAQYPGAHDYTLDPNPSDPTWPSETNTTRENPNAGKPGQARWANQYMNARSPFIAIGYSAGADSAVLFAKLRRDSGNPITSLVLIDPAFDSTGLNGGRIGLEDYQSYIKELQDNGTSVLIVDTTKEWENKFPGASYHYETTYDHSNVDDSNDLTGRILEWVKSTLQ